MINIGKTITDSFCEGYFGRDFSNAYTYRIETEGYDWIVIRNENNHADFVQFKSEEDKQNCINTWTKPKLEENE